MNKILILLFIPPLLASCIGKHKSEAQKAIVNEQSSVSKSTGDTTRINLVSSKILWKGTEMRGAGKHEGEIQLQNAYFLTKNDQLVGGNFIVDMETIGVTDIPEHESIAIRNLNNHLKSIDFFDVKNYPTSKFEITNIKKLTSDSLKVSGNLTLKNITKNIEFKALNKNNSLLTKFTFNRFQWNIAYKGNWADKTLIDKEIELIIELTTEL